MKSSMIAMVFLVSASVGFGASVLGQSGAQAPKGAAKVRADAALLRPLFAEGPAGRFLDTATSEAAVPPIEPRVLGFSKSTRVWLTLEEAIKLPDSEKTHFAETPCDESQYYETKYGSPLVYARVLEVAAEHGASFDAAAGVPPAVMDFGYGTIGHLMVMGAMGIETVGVDVDPYLWALYAPERAAGRVQCLNSTKSVALNLFKGQWPAEAALVDQVRAVRPGGFDVITSKNTLKNGYLHPTQPVDEKKLVKLGVSDEAFVDAVFASLKPGGLFVIYNISPRPSRENEAYKPWADGRCPFSRGMLERAGFEALVIDENDDAKAEAVFKALGYPVTDLKGEKDLFALYTVVRRPGR